MNPPASESFCSQEELSVQTTGYEERQKWPDGCSSMGEWEPCMQSHHHQNKTELRNTITGDKESGHALGRKRMKADLPREQNRQSSWTAPTPGQPPQPSLPKGAKVKPEEQAGSEVQEAGPKHTISKRETVELHPYPARACPGPRVLRRTYGPVYSFLQCTRLGGDCMQNHV